ncbi:DUF1311 domain-containing protein [Pseudomonas sp. J452]|uniref:DUF1311 domain-containing protein n=1 Tax=Pseudomonas sp. J452 TaxID=2898441 RepID=UPI0021ADA903|nr:DUF1311 domain-containing protein [Pseudomonas sp. J452]UUY07357.1 DUF1311 domain-containing protein [Pseudomonas sp. J452]
MKILKVLALFITSLNANAIEYVKDIGNGRLYSAREPRECFDISETITINQCIIYFDTESQKSLDETLANIQEKVKRDIELLNDAQEKWTSFRHSECKVQSVPGLAFRDPTSQVDLFYKACTAKLNLGRIEQLKSITLGCDSCVQ